MAAPFVSGPIQVLPAGLLGLLQLKSPSGRNPEVLEGNVQPTVDLMRLWLNGESEMWNVNSALALASSPNGVLAPFGPNSIIVPQSEWWYVNNYSIRAGQVAGDTTNGLRGVLTINRVGTVRSIFAEHSDSLAGAGAIVHSWSGFWAPPGSEFGLFANNTISAVTTTFLADLWFARLRV